MLKYQASPEVMDIKRKLNKLVVVKLNGGLGTSMGCKGPKSVIEVRSDLTFLDLTVRQIAYMNKKYESDVPLVLMNSFNTDDETQKIIEKYANEENVKIVTFNQSKYPRIHKESLMPIAKGVNDSSGQAWYPPGHGDFYRSFYDSGLLDQMIKEGKEYCFLSNIDNLGATVDLGILDQLITKGKDFIMELTPKTKADVKGGTLILYEDKLSLLEVAQVPKDHLEEFKSIKKFSVFNTNNIWGDLRSFKKAIEDNTLEMEVIVNHKTLDNGVKCIQLETAVGAAIKSFEKSSGITVPRSRFLPVKKTSDLLLIMSNLYNLCDCKGLLTMSPKRLFGTAPAIKLGDQHFKKVKRVCESNNYSF